MEKIRREKEEVTTGGSPLAAETCAGGPSRGSSRGSGAAHPACAAVNTPQAKCDVHRIDVNAINNEKRTIAVYRILGICDVHRI